MNWQDHPVLLWLWCAQPIMQSVVAIFLWRRKLHKQFPVFFIFLLVQVANFCVTFPLWLAQNERIYFYIFWFGEAVNAVLGFKVIHEIFLDVFRPYHTLKDLGTLLFKWAGVVMLLVSVVVAFSNSAERFPLIHALTTLKRSVLVVQLGLILFLLLFSRFLGVSWKQISFGLSLGFGLVAGVELILYALNSGGYIKAAGLSFVDMAVYNAATLIWWGYLASPSAVREVAVNHLQTDRWEQGLADLETAAPPDSLIPMFESMVERAFSKSSHLDRVATPVALSPPNDPPRATSAAAGSKTRS